MKKLEFINSSKKEARYKQIKLKNLSKAHFDKYIKIWNEKYNQDLHNGITREVILDNVFGLDTEFKDFIMLYAKCVLLDKFYSTNVAYMDDLVKSIYKIENLSDEIKNGKAEFVDELKRVESKTINYTSFASKFCRRCKPEKYPIFDNIVKDLLKYYYNTNSEFRSKIKLEDKWDNIDYVTYKKIVDAFIDTFKKEIPDIVDYVKLDRYLWSFGKEINKGINYVKQIRKVNSDSEKLKLLADELDYNCKGEDVTAEELEDYVCEKYELV